jgi:hypothetical protein
MLSQGEMKDLDAEKDEEDESDEEEDGSTGGAAAAVPGAPIVKIKREKRVKTETGAQSSANTSRAVASLGKVGSAVRQISTLLTDPKLKSHLEVSGVCVWFWHRILMLLCIVVSFASIAKCGRWRGR